MRQRETKTRICMKCNIYHISCHGERFAWATRLDGQRRKDCKNRVFEVNNIPSPMQVEAFTSLYKTKIKGEMDKLTAFTEAIVQTSDDAYSKAARERPDLMEEYYRRKNARKAMGAV